MSGRLPRALPWTVAALGVGGAGAGLLLSVRNGVASPAGIATLLGALSFCVTAAVLIRRLPPNIVGWLLALVGVCVLALLVGEQYALFSLKTSPGTLPGGLVAAWIGGWVYAPMVTALVVWLPLTFPTGRLLSSRWRLVAWAGGLFMVLAVISNGLLPGSSQVQGISRVRNPFALAGAEPILRQLNLLAAVFALAALAGSLASMVVRFRRAGSVERQQIKLVTAALALTPLPLLVHDASAPALSNTLFAVILPLVPVAVAAAVLRYRLYDFDRLISRTVSYAVLTALLIGVYVGLVTVAARLVPARGSLGVAVSTLAVAALFRPLRRRTQTVVDRRFNRSRFDAERTVDAFSRRLRSEVDLETVRVDLLGVVLATMQPTSAWVWLRSSHEVSR